jgi:dynein heavy chain 1
MLVQEYNKFKTIDTEFVRQQNKVKLDPKVMSVLDIPDLGKTLEKWVRVLGNIRKALGDYLEKQRQNFARFYFVGDDDLLEIIGNSKEIKAVQRHFPKMFAGITTV